MTRLMIAAALALLPTIAAAQAQLEDGTAIRPEDRDRLDSLMPALGGAMRQVLSDGSAADVTQATSVLRGPAMAKADPMALAGDWSCSMTKMGGVLPVVDYPAFKCRVSQAGGKLVFEKLTGSQRTKGEIHRDGDQIVYLGSSFIDGDQPARYADFPADMDTTNTDILPDVGLVEVTGNDAARIIFPQPYKESYINVLTLTR